MVSNSRLTSGTKKYNKFYFLHIPKSGGRYLNKIAIYPISEMLINRGTDWINNENHEGWSNRIDNSTYIISIVRDPVKLICSWFLFFSSHGKLKDVELSSQDILDEVKNSMIDFLKHNDWVHNFQSKHLVCNYLDVPMDLAFSFSDIDLDVLNSRIERIDFIVTQDYLQSNPFEVSDRIFRDLNVFPDNIDLSVSDEFISNSSRMLYNSLSETDLDIIKSYFKIDYYIYSDIRDKEMSIGV